jgi:uncharacterized Zn finger protein
MPRFLSPLCPACASLDTEHIPLEEDMIQPERLLWICLDCGQVWRAQVQALPSSETPGPSV